MDQLTSLLLSGNILSGMSISFDVYGNACCMGCGLSPSSQFAYVLYFEDVYMPSSQKTKPTTRRWATLADYIWLMRVLCDGAVFQILAICHK